MPAGSTEQATPDPVVLTPARTDLSPTVSGNRKSSKPIMEKRRRARINESLGQLKTLILEALRKDTSRHSKLEKADILEMTVRHLRGLRRLQLTAAVQADPGLLLKYRAGFSECVGEVTRFLSACEGFHVEVRARLLNHLASCMSQMSSVSPPLPPCKTALGTELVNLYSGVQLLPRPEGGHVAILMPGVALSPAGPHGGALSPLGSALSPVGTALSPLGSALSPVNTARSPVGPTLSPHNPTLSPVGPALSPVGAALSPVGLALSPVGPALSPGGPALSPLGPALAADSVWRPW